jgi:hypothetical protein
MPLPLPRVRPFDKIVSPVVNDAPIVIFPDVVELNKETLFVGFIVSMFVVKIFEIVSCP